MDTLDSEMVIGGEENVCRFKDQGKRLETHAVVSRCHRMAAGVFLDKLLNLSML